MNYQFSLVLTFYLTKTENMIKKTLTSLMQLVRKYVLHFWLKTCLFVFLQRMLAFECQNECNKMYTNMYISVSNIVQILKFLA